MSEATKRRIDECLIIRVDASAEIGTGHLMRCLALAQAWKDAGGKVIFITACRNEALLQRLREEEFEVHQLTPPYPEPNDFNLTKRILAEHSDTWVVLDGYHFDETYQKRIKESGNRLLVIDDMAHLKHYYADIVLNQNLHAEQLHYLCEPYTKLLLGTRYVLLRREFLKWRGWKREIPDVARRVLVSLGGSDTKNVSLKIMHALQQVNLDGLEGIVVVGATNPNYKLLQSAIQDSAINIQLKKDIKDIPKLMAWADMAVASAGITTWELLFSGIPTLFLISADNQRYNAEQVENQKIGKNLGRAENVSIESLVELITLIASNRNLRLEMSKNAQQTVDGEGCQRVITAMQETIVYSIKLRKVSPDDCHLLWEWRNDPVTRANSFNSHPIPWEEHKNWFQQKLADPNCLIYIAINEAGKPISQVRFDIDSEGRAEVGISIDAKERNKGYGSALLKLACQYVFKERNIKKVIAHIKEENKASIKAFSKAGFVNNGLKYFKGYKIVEMVWLEEET